MRASHFLILISPLLLGACAAKPSEDALETADLAKAGEIEHESEVRAAALVSQADALEVAAVKARANVRGELDREAALDRKEADVVTAQAARQVYDIDAKSEARETLVANQEATAAN